MGFDAYAVPGAMTALTTEQVGLVRHLGLGPVDLCRVAQGLLVGPDDAFGAGLGDERLAERNTRPVSTILDLALARDPSPLDQVRAPKDRVVGTCRHYAVLATALLRAAGVPARARCGFAAYFVPERVVDHWITEHRAADDDRWIRIDPEIVGAAGVDRPDGLVAHDLGPDDFVTGGEAWQRVRSGRADPAHFGVFGTDHWGPGEIRGNALRDLAALRKVEVLPWDEWGPMEASYAGTAGEGFDRYVDELAAAAAADDEAALVDLYARHPVPPDLQR